MDETCQVCSSVELTEEDKVLIMELFVHEMFTQAKTNLNDQNDQPHFDTCIDTENWCEILPDIESDINQLDEECLELTKETREKIIKHLVKKFFQNKNKFDLNINDTEKESEISLNDQEQKMLMELVDLNLENETKCNSKVSSDNSFEIDQNKTEIELDDFNSNVPTISNNKLPVNHHQNHKTNKNSVENTVIDFECVNSSVTCNLDLSSTNEANKIEIGLSLQEETEIKDLIESIEKEYMRNLNDNEEESHMRNIFCNGCSSITNSLREDNFPSEHEVKIMHKTEEFVECFQMNENKLNKIDYSNDTMNIPYEDAELTDSVTTQRKTNDDELTPKTTKNKNTSTNNIKREVHEAQEIKANANHKNKINKSRYLLPMNDKDSPFHIDREMVPVFIYQQGLKFSKWNPTQVLYEICSQCFWPSPEFIKVDYTQEKGFLVGVKVNEHNFLPDKRGYTLKLAKHEASTHFLNFIGFKFTYNCTQAFNFTSENTNNWENYRRRNENNNANNYSNSLMCSKQMNDNLNINLRCKIRKRESISPEVRKRARRSGSYESISSRSNYHNTFKNGKRDNYLSHIKCHKKHDEDKTYTNCKSIKYETLELKSTTKYNSYFHKDSQYKKYK